MNQANRRTIALFTAIAFLFQIFLPFIAVYDVKAAELQAKHDSQNAKEMQALFGDKVVICTSEGFKIVSWQDILSGKEKPKPHPKYKCPACYIAAQSQKMALPQALPVLIVSASLADASIPIPREGSEPRFLLLRGSLSRAPPRI